ncbi:MAG TPA: tetraacyldisaccharide 4'-kinase [Gemmataceae bacterium]|nr:tetraacyldisaccharide 4'-kinase [Gemmataceae bacterium]
MPVPSPSAPGSSSDRRRRYLAVVRGEARGFGPSLQRLGLSAAAVPYGIAVRLRNIGYDRGWLRTHRVPTPVVSVGNLTVGGTGKTPFVEHVAGFYRRSDVRVAVLSRGYGAETGPNDEALVLEENLPDVPHLQGKDRVALAQAAIEELKSELLVLDDGFQHRRLFRDLDLVLIDATQPWGFGRLLPRGLLREPKSGLRRAHLIALTRCDQVGEADRGRLRREVQRRAPGVPVIETTHRPVELVNADGETASLDMLRGRSIAAFCGVGNPEAFRRTLTDCGAAVRDFRVYPDHHAFTREDVADLRIWADGLPRDCHVVVTQKDLVKLRISRLGDRPLWSLRIRLHILAGADELERRLEAVRRGR